MQKPKVKKKKSVAYLATWLFWHMWGTVCGYVSMSLEEYSRLERVHTHSRMNEAERLELSCDSRSCQHGGVRDVWADPSLRAAFLWKELDSKPTSSTPFILNDHIIFLVLVVVFKSGYI